MLFKACPRCRGDLHGDKDHYGSYERCLQCGYSRDVQTRAEGLAERVGVAPALTFQRGPRKRRPEKKHAPPAKRGPAKGFPLKLHQTEHWTGRVARGTTEALVTIRYTRVQAQKTNWWYALVVGVEGWPCDRWSAANTVPLTLLARAFTGKTNLRLRGLGPAIARAQETYIEACAGARRTG